MKTTSSKNDNISNDQHVYHSKHENCNTNNNQEENSILTMMNPTLVVSSMNSIMSSTSTSSTTPSPFLQIPIPIWVSSSSSSTEVIEEEEEVIVSIQKHEIKEGRTSKRIVPTVQQGQFPNEYMCTTLRSPNVSNKLNHPNELVPLLPKPSSTTTTASLFHMLETKKNLELIVETTTVLTMRYLCLQDNSGQTYPNSWEN